MSRAEPTVSFLITCEHASHAVPPRWRPLFAGADKVLRSHRGWDPGTLELARLLAGRLDAPLLAGQVTRLLIDLNRSAGHPRRFSEWTRALPESERALLEREFWRPHWDAYRAHLDAAPGRLVHIACHSFTPVFEGRRRRVDFGLLYDPARSVEKAFCAELGRRLRRRFPELLVRMNQPYRGTANGIGQQHRQEYGEDRLLTVELEISQDLVARRDWPQTIAELTEVVAVSATALAGSERVSRASA